MATWANYATILGRTGEKQHVPVEDYKDNLRNFLNHLKENCKAQKWKMYYVNILAEMDDTDELCNSTTWKNTDEDFKVKHTYAFEDLIFYDPTKIPCSRKGNGCPLH